MKTSTAKFPPMQLAKSLVRPCPIGRCKHHHIKGSGPCTEVGCACHGKVPVWKPAKKGGH